jgi:asparagine synthase (glutamine-hydrolysing)
MCGVAGVFTPGGSLPAETRERISRMARCMVHRGPDHEGLWVSEDGAVGLAHRRLSIIDLSADGNQPMASPSGRYRLSYNGEVYNYLELRAELEARGRSFQTRSDTEVLLAAFEEFGLLPAIEKVHGMFAIAVWDEQSHVLSLIRDRAGKKPLYYSISDGRLVFASELNAMKSATDMGGVDPESLHHYLTLGYVPGLSTIYRKIREVPAGGYVEADGKLDLRQGRYWLLPAPAPEMAGLSFKSAVDATEEALTEALRIRLRADVPVGVFLSGGIDSGLLVALAAGMVDQPLKTFTIGLGEAAYDESGLARLVAQKYGTDHTEIRLDPDPEALLPRVVAAYGEPFADPSALPSFAVAAAASSDLKVVLNGEGADELFAGYRRAWAVRRAQQASALFSMLPKALVDGVHSHLPRPRGHRTPYALGFRFLKGVLCPPGERYLTWSSDGFSEAEKQALYRSPTSVRPTAQFLEEEWECLLPREELARFMALDLSVGTGDCLLFKMDIATMASSLEARSPFLDHGVMELAARLPRKLHFRGKRTKPILRALADRLLPHGVAHAPKRGFEIPLADWVDGAFAGTIRESLMDSGFMRENFRAAEMVRVLNDSAGLGRERRARLLWILFMLAQWAEA